MHILKVTQVYHPYLEKGGPVVKIRGLAKQLARRGHHITVLTADLGLGEHDPEITKASHVTTLYLPTWAQYRAVTFNPGVIIFCIKHLRQFDVVHIYGFYDLLGPVVAWFCRRWNIPYVLEPMGMYWPIIRSLRKKRFYHRILGPILVKGAAYFIATSEQERQELIAEGVPAEKIVERRNGLDLSEFEHLPPLGTFRQKLGLTNNELLLLYLGRLSRKKGLDLLLRAFALITIPARLVIVGPDNQDGCVQELEQLRTELALQDRVVMAGPRFGQEKLEAFIDADIFVLPSRNENFGNAAAEAIACGIPVIVTDQCGIAPYVRDRAGLVVPFAGQENQGRVEALRQALERLLTDHQLRKRLRVNTEQVKQELSWDEPVGVQEQLYATVVMQRAR